MKSKIFKFNNFYTGNVLNAVKIFSVKPLLRCQLVDVDYRTLIYGYSRPLFRSYRSKFKASCLLTGRSRGTLAGYIVSRITFKKFAIEGSFAGFKKSRW